MVACLLEKYYETEPTGGCLHIITDDGNYLNKDAKFCLDYSIEKNDYWGEVISKLLLEFNKEEREQIIERPWEINDMI